MSTRTKANTVEYQGSEISKVGVAERWQMELNVGAPRIAVMAHLLSG